MPGTFRAFLQGLSASIPQVVQLLDKQKDRDLNERQVNVQEKTLKLAQDKYTTIEQPLAEDTIRSNQFRDNLAEKQAEVDMRLKKLSGDYQAIINQYQPQASGQQIDLGNQQLKQGEKNLDMTDAQMKKVLADTATAYAQAHELNQRASMYGLQKYSTELEIKTKLAQLVSSASNDPNARNFFTMQFTRPEDMNAYLNDPNNKFTPEFAKNAAGIVGQMLPIIQQERQNKIALMSTGKTAKEQAKIGNAYDADSQVFQTSIYNMLWNDNEEPKKETAPVDEKPPQGTGFKIGNPMEPLSNFTKQGGVLGGNAGRLPLYGASSVLSPQTNSWYK